jgi:predicted RNA binding protein YcfA (HicA-like mRNA interferase family)
MKKRDFIRIFNLNGIVFYQHGANHDIYKHEKSGKKIPIPRHNEFSNDFLKDILKEIPKN